MNRIIAIGWLGSMQCYLNVSREEALRRYLVDNPIEVEYTKTQKDFIREFEFEDEFWAYSVGPKD